MTTSDSDLRSVVAHLGDDLGADRVHGRSGRLAVTLGDGTRDGRVQATSTSTTSIVRASSTAYASVFSIRVATCLSFIVCV